MKIITMKKLILSCAILSIVGFNFAQTLEMQNVDAPSIAEGPVYSTEPWVMTPEGTLGAISVTAEFSNQQYTNITTQYNESGLMFGAISRNYDLSADNDNQDFKVLKTTNIYDGLGSFGAPRNEFFSASSDEIGSGIDASNPIELNQNGAFIQYSSVEGIAKNSINAEDNDEYYLGDVTYTFSQPVDNPVIHISGLGGRTITGTSTADATYLFFSTELELTGSSSEYSLQRLSGSYNEFVNSELYYDVDVTNKKIVNRYGDTFDPRQDETGASGYDAGSGSVLIVGEDITEVSFKVTVRAKSDGRWTQDDMYAGDIYTVSWSLQDPVCVVEPASGTPEKTFVGISTLDRNVDEWLLDSNNENELGAYIVLESGDKAFIVSRNDNPGPYKGETANSTDNIQNPIEGMVVWDTTKNCLSLYKVDDSGNGFWSCVNIGCNQ